MRVAALFDIHGNLPALEAVLQDVGREGVDQIVVGSDAVLGPMPRETLERLLELRTPVQFIHGNCELAILAQMACTGSETPAYWGTTSGGPLPEQYRAGYRWTADQLRPDYQPVLSSWPKTARLEIDGLGTVLFCHGTPQSETEIVLRSTPEAPLVPRYQGLGASVVVCGHTHMQFDRMIGRTRVVNAGSVGAGFGAPGAAWALLGPDVRLERTRYDFEQAAERIRATSYPDANETAQAVIQPPSEDEMLALFSKAELR